MSSSVSLRQQAAKCIRLARSVGDELTRSRLEGLAADYSAQADLADHQSQTEKPSETTDVTIDAAVETLSDSSR